MTDEQRIKVDLLREYCDERGLSLVKMLASERRAEYGMSLGAAVDRLYERVARHEGNE